MAQSSAMHRFCRLPMPSYEKIFADANTILDEIISQFHTYRKPNQTMEAQVVKKSLVPSDHEMFQKL